MAPREVRQPEVARLTTLVLAALLVVPVARAAWTLLATAALLIELLSAGTSTYTGSGMRPAERDVAFGA